MAALLLALVRRLFCGDASLPSAANDLSTLISGGGRLRHRRAVFSAGACSALIQRTVLTGNRRDGWLSASRRQ
jgi:hypothetical protein